MITCIYISRLGTDWGSDMYVDIGSTEDLPVFNYESIKSIYIYHGEERNVEFHCE